ncbi:Kanadaptin [Perkinsus olseni]|uniref:Kanadaptin n=1 Tax=Perkinsus olseni TaxID=32597 RepID=A0A7J6PN35_PEROL|nr:Kanadaptin [Perkinsus olseni]
MTEEGSVVEEVGGETVGQQKANKTESEKRADFRQMLIDNGVDASWKWGQVADLAKKDMRYHALPTMGEKKQVFAEYLLHARRLAQQKERDNKREMMYEMVKAMQQWSGMSEDTRYDQLAADSEMAGQEWWGKLTEKERMTLFEAFADDYCEIQKKNRQARDERNMQQLKKALKGSQSVTYDMSIADLERLKEISSLDCWQQLQPNQRVTVWRTCAAAETRRLKNMVETGASTYSHKERKLRKEREIASCLTGPSPQVDGGARKVGEKGPQPIVGASSSRARRMAGLPAGSASALYREPEWSGPAKLPIYLEFIANGQVVREVDIRDDRKCYFMFGRDPAVCDIPLTKWEPRSSRHHAVLQFKEGSKSFYLYDLNSTHGTMVDGKKIPPGEFVEVHVGDQVQFSSTAPKLTLVIQGPEELQPQETEVDLTAFREEAQSEREVERQRHERDRERRRAMRQQERADRRAEKISAVVGAANPSSTAPSAASTGGVFRGVREDDGLEEAMMEADAQDELTKDVFDETGLQIDTRKLEQLQLNDKQRQLLLKIADKRRKLESNRQMLETAQMEAGGGPSVPSWRNTGAFEDEVERIKSTHQKKFQGDANKLYNRVNRMESDLQTMTDNLLLSLGIKNPMRDRMKRTPVSCFRKSSRRCTTRTSSGLDEEDDYYDQASAEMRESSQAGGKQPHSGETGEYDDLPSVTDGAETAKTLTEKKKALVSLLRETVAVVQQKEAQMAMKKATASRADSLDAYMVENEVKLIEGEKEAAEKRGLAIKERLEGITKLLSLAMAGSTSVDEVEQAKQEQRELEAKRAARAEALAAAKAARKEAAAQQRKKARMQAPSDSIFGSELEADDMTKAAIKRRAELMHQQQQQQESSSRVPAEAVKIDPNVGGLQGQSRGSLLEVAEEPEGEEEAEGVQWPEIPTAQYDDAAEESTWVPPADNDEKQEALRKKLGY